VERTDKEEKSEKYERKRMRRKAEKFEKGETRRCRHSIAYLAANVSWRTRYICFSCWRQ
jgi:hypothetical protein